MKRHRKKKPRERNFFVPLMRAHCKPGAHADKKKEASRKACRAPVKPEDGIVALAPS